MFINLDGATLEQIQDQEECKRFILSAFALKHETAKDIIEASETSFQVYAYRYDAGMSGTSGIQFLVSNDTEESILDSLWDALGEHVQQYSYTWHVDYSEESEDFDPYEEELNKHRDNAMHCLELYNPKLHHGKIPGGSKSVQFELLY